MHRFYLMKNGLTPDREKRTNAQVDVSCDQFMNIIKLIF